MKFIKRLSQPKMRCQYMGDYLGVRNKNLGFMSDEKFNEAWSQSKEAASLGWKKVPDIRWRTHIAIWAAQHGLNLEGDFVECGVYTGILSLAICNYLQFQNVNKKFYLYDLWDAVPLDCVEGDQDQKIIKNYNGNLYASHDVYESTKRAFSAYPNCKMIKGLLPDTLSDAPEKIAYLSIDLNNMSAEKACAEVLWPRLTSGAIVVLDDYAWNGHEQQYQMWNEFAAAHGTSIACLPTAQGILIKP